MFEYRMIQAPPTLVVRRREDNGREAALYLEGIVNEQATQGWEFYRVDTIGVKVKPGCLGAFSGQREATIHYYVVTFRRPLALAAQ